MAKKFKSEADKAREKYINGNEFARVKELIYDKYNGRCGTCNCDKSETRAFNVHHKTYEHLYDELNHLDDLILLCSRCHLAVHRANPWRFKIKEE